MYTRNEKKMFGTLIFNNVNDLIYSFSNEKFDQHINAHSAKNSILGPSSELTLESESGEIKPKKDFCYSDIVVQLFSPLVTSQNVLKNQFGNCYDSITCEDGTIIVFQEFSDFLFLCVGSGHLESYLFRCLKVTIELVKMTVGPCVTLLRTSRDQKETLDGLLTSWFDLYWSDQCYLVEAIQRRTTCRDSFSALMASLSSFVKNVYLNKGLTSVHSALFIENKLLASYSSQNSDPLSEANLLFINLFLRMISTKNSPKREFATSVYSSPANLGAKDSDIPASKSFHFSILLKTKFADFSPHHLFLVPLNKSGVTLALITEVNRSQLSGQLLDVLTYLDDLRAVKPSIRGQSFIEFFDTSLRNLENFMSCLPDSTHSEAMKNLQKVTTIWEGMKGSGLSEWLVDLNQSELPVKLEAASHSATVCVKTTWSLACLDMQPVPTVENVVSASTDLLEGIEEHIRKFEASELVPKDEVGVGLSIHKYIEEFPGLVHFLYIDRCTHELTSPSLSRKCLTGSSTYRTDLVSQLTLSKLWSMVTFARSHLSKGHTSVLWKDRAFSYSYFLWFEDADGNSLKAPKLREEQLTDLPLPGVLCGDFYRAFAELLFPDKSVKGVKVYELFCFHLGMVTSSCILEQTRRLAATIWEVSGLGMTNPIDSF